MLGNISNVLGQYWITSTVWHAHLLSEQAESPEDIQARACKIAMPHLHYESALKEVDILNLSERRVLFCKSFFEKIQNPNVWWPWSTLAD